MLLAALRNRIPRPRPISASAEVAGHPEHRSQDAVVGERHGRAVTGRGMPMPTPKAARTPISAVGSTTPVSTMTLETTTCQRRGTAAMVARSCASRTRGRR